MCGIVGHMGSKNSVNVMISILQRLEYRGYDSAGICVKPKVNDDLLLYKKTGKLDRLKEHIDPLKLHANIGIGHTRWATHGGISDFNAHPHVYKNVALVCNGIIENANSLKEDLLKEGWKFKSETDTEVFLILVKRAMENEGLSFKEAIAESFKVIRGNCAVVIMDREKDEIVSIRRSAPLVLGLSEKRANGYVASDPYALVGHIEDIYYPESEVMGVIGKKGNKHEINFFDLELNPSDKFIIKKQVTNTDVIRKGKFEHYMLKEIYEQPGRINDLAEYYTSPKGRKELKGALALNRKRIHITACGTAWHAGLVIKNYIEQQNRIPVSIDLASEFRYRNPILSDDELSMFISQSGETADTLSAAELCNSQGVDTLSIINVMGSSIYRECSKNLLINAGVEIGVASTKAFTLQALTGYIFSSAMKTGKVTEKELTSKFSLLSKRIESVLAMAPEIEKIAEKIFTKKGFIFTGRGIYFPIALEGALKLKEIAYVHAEGYASGELKHGPLALIDKKMVNIAIVGPELYEKTVSNIEEVKARKGNILVIGPENNEELEKLSDFYIPINFEGLGDLAPLVANVANQLLSYYIAKSLGTDIDKPRNLAKSVTVE